MTSQMHPRQISSKSIHLQVIGQESLIYDERNHQAWCLNGISACVWRCCDGQKTVEQIACVATAELGVAVSVDVVLVALAEQRERNLLEPDTLTALPDAVSRREMIGKAGLAAAALLPVISSIFTPSASAQSGSMTGMTGTGMTGAGMTATGMAGPSGTAQ